MAAGERVALRLACARVQGWPVGTVRVLGTPEGEIAVDDLFALDLAAVADAATARRGSLGSAALVASLRRMAGGADHAGTLAGLLGLPVHSVLAERPPPGWVPSRPPVHGRTPSWWTWVRARWT